MGLRIHLLIQDDKGPIASNGLTLNAPQGPVEVAKSSKLRAACDPKILMGELDRGTGDPWAVRCHKCFETEAFKKINRPKPGTQAAAVNDTVDKVDATPPPCC